MLEKIGLPAKPAARGSSWVLDASHCQGCTSAFSLFNRKHYCRRCGGLFCGNCTQQRMVLRGQGEGLVRICEPCKQLEDATRFESRYGQKNRTSKGGSKASSRKEKQLVGMDVSAQNSGSSDSIDGDENDIHKLLDECTSTDRTTIEKSHSINISMEPTKEDEQESSVTPEVLRQQAHEEKLKWTELRREGKGEEAMRAFKRGKELERQAEALEMSIKRNHRRAASSSVLNREKRMESGGSDQSKRRHGSASVTEGQQDGVPHGMGSKITEEKDDLLSALKELGWNEADLQDADKKQSKNKSLESELSELAGVAGASKATSAAADTGGKRDASSMQILAHKRRALALKREGKMTEAKEELKKAKIIEKQLEEQEMDGGEESDEELASLIRNLEKEGKMRGKGSMVAETTALDAVFNLDNLSSIANEDDDTNVEVTDLDMNDPEMVTALRSLGWGEEADALEKLSDPGNPGRSTAIRNQVMEGPSNFKQDGSMPIFDMTGKNELQERNRGGLDTFLDPKFNLNGNEDAVDVTDEDMKDPYFLSALSAMGFMDEEPKKIMQPLMEAAHPQAFEKANLQQEILFLKKEALALKRAGKLEEAKEELRQAKRLEKEMQEMQAHHIDEAGISVIPMAQKSSLLPKAVEIPYSMHIDGFSTLQPVGDDIDVENVEVTEEDMDDPELAKVLRSLGWQDDSSNMEHNIISKPYKSVHPTPNAHKSSLATPSFLPSKTRSDLQKDLLGLKRAALKLKREGRNEEAEEELQKAKILEKQMEMLETAKVADGRGNQTGKQEGDELCSDLKNSKRRQVLQSLTADVEKDSEEVTEDDMKDPDMLAALQGLGWSEDQDEMIQKLKGQDEVLYRKVADETAPLHFNDTYLANAAVHLSSLENSIEGPATQFDQGKGVDRSYSSSRKEDVSLTQPRKTEQVVNTSSLIALDANNMVEVLGENGKTSMLTNQDLPLFDYEQGSAIMNINPTLPVPARMIDLLTGDDWGPKAAEPEGGTLQDLLVPNVSATLQGLGYEARMTKISQELQEESQRVVLSKEVGETKPFAVSKMQKGAPQMVEDSHKIPAKEAVTEMLGNAEGEITSDAFPVEGLQQEVLLHKRKALALKHEGKLAEAKEELRQARSIEKRLALLMSQQEKPIEPMQSTSIIDVSGRSTTLKVGQEKIFIATSPVQRTSASLEGSSSKAEVSSSESDAATAVLSTPSHTAGRNPAQKHVHAGKERMKLQQESLAHKRKALALRREGKVEEAEGEFEQAKALEKQMEEMDGKLATAPGIGHEEDDVGSVENILDPQLLAALKGLGWKDTEIFENNAPKHGQEVIHSNTASQKSSGSGSSKVVGAPNNKQKQHEERKHLEEQIKSEKMRALQLKRSGRQSEALDVLRGAKRLEKQLESMD